MSEVHEPTPLPSVEQWRGEFMEAAQSYASRRRNWTRRLLVPLAVLAGLTTAGVATATIIERLDDPEVPPFKGETHAYLNLETGEPIRCPGGALLTYTPAAGTDNYGPARCDDGSVPTVYQEQLAELRRYQEQEAPRFGASVEQAPRFEYALPDTPAD